MRRAPDKGMLRVEGASSMGTHSFVIDHRSNFAVAELDYRIDLVRGAEAIEEMEEWHSRAKGRSVGDERRIMGFLDRARGQHGKAGRPRRHHVGMVAEDRQRLRGD